MSRNRMDSNFYYPETGHRPDLVPYIGGKSELIGHIVPIIDYAIEHYRLNEFHELCGGGARMLLNLPFSRLNKRVYNDIDIGMCALFYCCSQPDLLSKLMAQLEQMGVGAKVFQEAKQQRKQNKIGEKEYVLVIAAACAYIVILQSQKARQNSFNNMVSERSYLNRISRLPQYLETLRGIKVTNRSVFDILVENRDWSHSFIYLDPPYYETEMASNDHYEENWTIDDHAELVKLLLFLPLGKVALSGLDNPSYKRLEEAGWKKLNLKNLRIKSSDKGRCQEEQLWINFKIPASLEATVSEYCF